MAQPYTYPQVFRNRNEHLFELYCSLRDNHRIHQRKPHNPNSPSTNYVILFHNILRIYVTYFHTFGENFPWFKIPWCKKGDVYEIWIQAESSRNKAFLTNQSKCLTPPVGYVNWRVTEGAVSCPQSFNILIFHP